MKPTLSKIQKDALKKTCPVCGCALRVLGDLGDFAHDFVSCSNEECDYVLLFNGETIQ